MFCATKANERTEKKANGQKEKTKENKEEEEKKQKMTDISCFSFRVNHDVII